MDEIAPASTSTSGRRRRRLGPRLEPPLEWRRTGLKICLACTQAKPATDEYYTVVKGAPTSRCKSCVAAAENERAKYLQRLYGISKDDYALMLARQGGVCAICGRPPAVQRRRLGVDHDHRTGRVRGLLCSACNAGIAGLREDPQIFAAALRYLSRFKDVESAPAVAHDQLTAEGP